MAEEQKTGCSPSDCAGCSHAGECGSKPQSLIKPENKKSHINHVIAVVSGKGGVGKSMVTASLARLMREQGFSVGIMDADITGPSIRRCMESMKKQKGMEKIFSHVRQRMERRLCPSTFYFRKKMIRLSGEVLSSQVLSHSSGQMLHGENWIISS